MTYLAEARAGDWGHEWHNAFGGGVLCKACGIESGFASDSACPIRIARFAREKVIAEIEALAKERCQGCNEGREHYMDYPGLCYDTDTEEFVQCAAQPEQRRLAQLRAELQALEEPAKK